MDFQLLPGLIQIVKWDPSRLLLLDFLSGNQISWHLNLIHLNRIPPELFPNL